MSKQPIKVFVDADPLVYRCGYACEEHTYEVIAEDSDGELRQLHFENGDAKKEYFKANPDLEILESTRLVNPEPLYHVLHTVKLSIEGIQQEIEQKYKCPAELSFYLSGPDNFRIDLATIREYKGNRTDEKPYHYQGIRDYLTNTWGAHVVHGREADDEVSILARGSGGVVSTIDKDLDQIPGRHYDYAKKVHYTVSAFDAMRYFYVQALSGDSGDNIGGCFRVGPAGAEKLVDQWIEDFPGETDDLTALESWLWDRVVTAYADSKDRETAKLKCEYKDMDPAQVALENARLVKMQEYEGQLWTPVGEPDDLLEVF